MAYLTLWFTEENNRVELFETAFAHAELEQELKTIRGRSPLGLTGHQVFRWTPAVQALCLLMLRTVGGDWEKALPETKYLEGATNSPAASLDYALSKQTNWLLDIFGLNYQGHPIARSLMPRINAERKRGGLVKIFINQEILPAKNISIYLDNKLVNNQAHFFDLAEKIERSFKNKKAEFDLIPIDVPSLKNSTLEKSASVHLSIVADVKSVPNIEDYPVPFNRPEVINKLKINFRHEIFEMLYKTDIFNKNLFLKSVQRIYDNPYFRKHAGRSPDITSEIDLNLSSAERVGMSENDQEIRDALCQDKPITFAASPGFVGASALFQYLKHVKGYNIDINYRYAHGVGIANRIRAKSFNKAPDCCVVSIASAAPLLRDLSKINYRPLMFMPKVSARVITSGQVPDESATLHFGDYVFLADTASNSSFYFYELARNGVINRKDIKVAHMEADEATQALSLKDPNMRAILWFPYYYLNEMFNGCRQIHNKAHEFADKETVLFFNNKFGEDPRRLKYLNIALRDAWLELKEGGKSLDRVVDLLVDDAEYLKFLKRASGLHALDFEETNDAQEDNQPLKLSVNY